MRLGIFQNAFTALGGAELLAATQAAWLAEQGVDVTVAAFAFDESAWRPILGPLPLRRIPKRTPLDPFIFWSKVLKLRARGRAVGRALSDFDAVLAHSHPSSALLGHAEVPGRKLWYCHEAPWRLHPEAPDYLLMKGLEAFRSRCDPGFFEILSAFRDGIRATSRRSAGLRRYDLAGAARVDTVMANSAFCRDALSRIYGRADILLVPPIVRFAMAGPRAGLDGRNPGVLVMARLELLKNVETVIRGFARLGRQRGARLHVVGEGRQRPRLERVAAELGIADSVTFHGYLDPVRDAEAFDRICAACDVFALLPLDESFGLVYPEAASRGLLLIGPEQGGPAEILDHGRLGRVAPALDAEAFAGALEATLSLSDEAAARQREAADRACRARFSIEAAGPLLKNVLCG
ncbi:MAG TPA: glycosyltransferase family 4 protein [Holophagaceae bacterium]|nr:glycosyltransferase family 4 protein [Holophagaceae bacterium]